MHDLSRAARLAAFALAATLLATLPSEAQLQPLANAVRVDPPILQSENAKPPSPPPVFAGGLAIPRPPFIDCIAWSDLDVCAAVSRLCAGLDFQRTYWSLVLVNGVCVRVPVQDVFSAYGGSAICC